MCTVLLPPGVNTIAVNKISNNIKGKTKQQRKKYITRNSNRRRGRTAK